jgi:HlyD family secretion protein
VRATVQASTDAVVVPRAALLTRDGKAGVFVIEGGSARWQPIDVGVSGEEMVEARQGLQAGATVATTGRSSLGDGMHVRSGDAASAR